MRKNIGIVYTAFWAAICACYGQATTNGTELADNLTSRSRVVVDAFENASNRVHALIQEVSPTPDLSGCATTGAVAAVSNAVAQVPLIYRDKTDMSVYGFAPFHIWTDYYDMNYDKARNSWWIQDGADYRELIWTNGVWRLYMNSTPTDENPYFMEATNDFFATSITFGLSVDIWRTSIYATNGAHLVTSADAMPYLSTTGGVVTGNIILPQTGGSGDKTTINGNGITAGMEGFTIDSFADTLVLKGSSMTINSPDTRFMHGWDSVRDGDGYTVTYLIATATNGLIGAAYIATNNPAFVAAVTNCPVAIAAADAEALTEWGIYGVGGTIGTLLAALAAAVVALRKKKMPLYPVGGTGNPVNATIESGVLTISPFAMAAYAPSASAAFSVAMGALPSDLEGGKARDAVLVIDCSSLSEGDEPTVTWGTAFHPRTDAGTDFACVAGAKNVYYISEYMAGEFAVGGWTETAGGSGT